MIKRILVPLDFSEPSLQALNYAIEFGRPFKAEFVVLFALEPLYYPMAGAMYDGLVYDMGAVYQDFERAGREQLSRIAATLKKKRLKARTVLRSGTAYEVILQTAKALKVDLIIMSTHGRTGLARAFLGSVTERVVRSATCPVLTVRAQVGGGRALRAGRARPAGRRATPAAKRRIKR